MYKTKDIQIFVGVDKDKNVIILPFIFNKQADKIKILTDNTIIDLINLNTSFYSVVEKKYNTELYEAFNLEAFVQAETILASELEELINALACFYKVETKLNNKPDNIDRNYKKF